MKLTFLALTGLALAASAVPAGAKNYVCTKWHDGICVSAHRVKGTPPYDVGYVFGPKYTYAPVNTLPEPLVTYYKLGPDSRYVYANGYLYEVDPTTYAITKVIDTWPH